MNLRSQILKERRSQSDFEIESKSRAIVAHLRETLSSHLKPGQVVASFRPMRDEPHIDSLSRDLIHSRQRVVFPRMVSKTEIEMREIIDFDGHLWSMARGFHQPSDQTLRIDPDEIAVFLVPGVVFGRQGERIGFGAGFYDRYLSRATPAAIKIGVAFDLQLVDSVEQNEWDVRMDALVTEAAFIVFGKQPFSSKI